MVNARMMRCIARDLNGIDRQVRPRERAMGLDRQRRELRRRPGDKLQPVHVNRERPIPSMKDDDRRDIPDLETQERQQRRDLRRALTFGVIMATIQMGILLYFMYC